jgi:predicted glycoside hydrolase/deacetylase ChbG (UPF0249 family)
MRLIVSADDFGLTAGVDRGIAAGVAAGTVTSVGVMANLADPAAVAGLAALRPGLSLGVHLNLTTGRPLSAPADVPSLVDRDGAFFPLATLGRRAFTGRVRAPDVRRELGAQIVRLQQAGIAVDHLDSHEHVHLLPGVFGAVVAVARGLGVPRMRTHRPALVGPGRTRDYYRRHPRRVLSHVAKRLLAVRLRRAGIATPDGMVAPSLLRTPVAGGPRAEWEAIAAALPPGTWELVVHPADLSVPRDATAEARLGELVARRGAELQALLDPGLRRTFAARGVALVPFSAVGDGAAPPRIVEESYATRHA